MGMEARTCLGPPAAGPGRHHPREAAEGWCPCQSFHFKLQASSPGRMYSCCVKLPGLGECYTHPKKRSSLALGASPPAGPPPRGEAAEAGCPLKTFPPPSSPATHLPRAFQRSTRPQIGHSVASVLNIYLKSRKEKERWDPRGF